MYSLWRKGLQWRCVTWFGFGSFCSIGSFWSVWSGNQLLPLKVNTFFFLPALLPKVEHVSCTFPLRSSYQSLRHSKCWNKSAPKLPVQQGKGWRNKKTELCIHGSTLGPSLQPGRVIILVGDILGVVSRSGKWRFIGDSLLKMCKNSGGLCYWEGGPYPRDTYDAAQIPLFCHAGLRCFLIFLEVGESWFWPMVFHRYIRITVWAMKKN